MAVRTLKGAVNALLLAASGLLFLPTSSQAAFFVGNFDPDFGAGFTNLGYRGEGTFVIPDECLSSTGLKQPGDPCWPNPGDAYLQSLFVEFYDSSVVPPPEPPTALTVTFGSPNVPVSLTSFWVAFNPLTDQNELFSVGTNLIGPQSANLSTLGFVTFPEGFFPSNALVSIDFDLDICVIECPTVIPGVFLTLGSSNPECEDPNGCAVVEYTSATSAELTFTRVPEPGTLSLLLGAVSATLLSRRRLGRARYAAGSRQVGS